jgi:hypothetical protein
MRSVNKKKDRCCAHFKQLKKIIEVQISSEERKKKSKKKVEDSEEEHNMSWENRTKKT